MRDCARIRPIDVSCGAEQELREVLSTPDRLRLFIAHSPAAVVGNALRSNGAGVQALALHRFNGIAPDRLYQERHAGCPCRTEDPCCAANAAQSIDFAHCSTVRKPGCSSRTLARSAAHPPLGDARFHASCGTSDGPSLVLAVSSSAVVLATRAAKASIETSSKLRSTPAADVIAAATSSKRR